MSVSVNDRFSTFTTDSINPPEAIVANTLCRRVTIQENGDSTQDYQVRMLSASSNPIKRQAGLPFTFSGDAGHRYLPGETVGWVETLAGSITMLQIEEF